MAVPPTLSTPPAPTRRAAAGRPAPLRLLAAVTCALLAGCGEDGGGESARAAAPATEVAARPHHVPIGDARRGRALFDRYQCGACHQIPEAVSRGTPWGPPLAAWGERSTLAGVLANDRQTLVRWLQDPPALVPGTLMPRLGVGPQDAHDLAAALLAMR